MTFATLRRIWENSGCLVRGLIILAGLFLIGFLTYLYAGNARIVFDGRVVDDQGRPVPDAEITYSINRAPPIPIPFVDFPFVNSHGTRRSGNDGTFHFRWRRGELLSIHSVTKPGYRNTLENPRSFAYQGYPGSPHRPVPGHPVNFLIVPANLDRAQWVRSPANLRFSWNEGVYEIPLGSGIGPLLLTPTRTLAPGKGLRIPWEMEISLVGARLAPVSGKEPIATLDGYRDIIHVSPAEKKTMLAIGLIQYDFLTATGRYGRIRLHVFVEREDMANHNASLDVILSPEGSRSLSR